MGQWIPGQLEPIEDLLHDTPASYFSEAALNRIKCYRSFTLLLQNIPLPLPEKKPDIDQGMFVFVLM